MKKFLLLLILSIALTSNGSAQNKKEKSPEKITESSGQVLITPYGAGSDQTLADCLTCPSYDYFISTLTSYQTHSSSIVSNGCRIYLVYVSENSTYTFKTGCGDGATAAFDTYLELYNYACVYTTGNDDGCESYRSIITWTATYSGYAYLKVRGYNSSHYGSYTLAYKSDPWCVACPSYEYYIGPVGTYQTHSSSISCYGCRIYYMDVTSGYQYTFKTGCGDGATADFDTFLELYNNSCSLIASDDDGCESNRSIINWTATYTGAAYLKVKGYGAYFGSYNLAYCGYNPNLCKTCPSYDFSIIPTTYYQTHSSSILSDGCKMYAATVTSGMQYTFKTGCGNGATADFDTYLELYDNGCSILAADDDGCESGRSQIVWNATYTGTVYLKVRGYASYAYGTYSLAYLEEQLPNIWFGTYNYQWENPVNWSLGHVPTATEEVIIAPYGYQPCILSISDQECKSLEIQTGASLVIDNKELINNGNMTINGYFTMLNASVLKIAGNWYRNPSTGIFTPGLGRVVFNNPYNWSQTCSSESFNILELSNAFNLYLASVNVTCNKYDWTSGAILCEYSSVFTANDLLDNGLFGTFASYDYSTINLYNYDGWVDVNGDIHIHNNSRVNVYGGTTYSYWTYTAAADIEIGLGSVLDFKDQGIIVNNSIYTLVFQNMGGTVRTSRGFIGNRADFQPTDCIFEFYGTSDYTISQSNGCTLHDVVINKIAKDGEKENPAGPLTDERSGMVISDGGKSNSISLDSDFTITGDLTVGAGSTFNLQDHDCMVANNVDISGILGITYPTDLSANRINWNSGSDDNITNGTIHVGSWYFYEGCFAHLGTGNTAYVTTGIYTNENTEFGNLVLADSKGNSGTINNEKGTDDLHVAGNLTVQTGPGWILGADAFIGGNMLLEPFSSISLYDHTGISVTGNAVIAGHLKSLYPNNNIFILQDLTLSSTGTLEINTAFLQCHGNGTFALNGSIILNSNGVIYFPLSSNIIGSTFNDNGITGGTLRIGGPLIALTPGTFQINSALVFFTGEVETRYINLAAGNWLDDVEITGSVFPQKLENDLLIKGNLDFSFATFNINGKTLTVDGDIDLSSGKLALQPGSHLDLGNGVTISQSGTFEALGTAGNPVHVYKGTSDNYSFNVQDNGHIKSSYTLFEGMNASGIHILGSGIVDPTYPFNNCTFSNGAATGSLLTFDNTQNLTIQSPVFPTNTWSGLYNITKTSNSGIIEVSSATGAFAGPDFENDPYSRVNWTGGIAGLWTGNVSSDWFTKGNWSSFTIPDAVVSVLIPPGCPNYPFLNGAQGNCFNLTVDPGANLTIGNNKILASNNVYISGNLTMTDALGCLQAEYIYFLAGSTDNVNYGEIRATQYFEFNEGTLAKFSGMNTVYCEWANCYDPWAEFANLHIIPYSKKGSCPNGTKTAYPIRVNGDFVMEPGSFYTPYGDVIVNGNTDIQSGAVLGDYMGPELDMTCNGNLTIAGNMRLYYYSEVLVHGNISLTGFLAIFPDCDFTCDYNSASGWTSLNGMLDLYPGSDFNITGANVLIGPSFNLIEQAPNPSYFNAGMTFGRSLSAPSPNFQVDHIYTSFTGNNTGHYINLNGANYLMSLAVNKNSGGELYLQSNITVKDFVIIGTESTLRAYDKTILVGGDWYENQFSGVGGFVPMTGRVIFNGTADQTVYGQADFNILEINKPGGKLVVPSGSSSVCSSFDYSAGGIRVDGGTFTANDLWDAGIYGNNQLISGTVNFTQDPLQELRLSGSLNISGGIMNVSGGSADFLWGFYENCDVTMSNGTLNVNCPEGLAIGSNSPGIFTENITGGTIKITNEIDILNSAFTPTGGTIELIGPVSSPVALNGSANLFNLTINKTATGDNLIPEDNETGQQSKNGKANDVYLATNVNISGTLTVAKGLLNLNGYEARVSGDAFINNGGTLTVNSGADLLMAANKILAVTEGGKLNVIGAAGNEARISRISTGNYTFNVDPGGTIGAQYGIFEYMGTNGIYIKSGSFVDPLYPFNNCTFRNGISGGRLITISNNQNFTVTNAVFPANTWGGSYNVYKNVTSGVVNFVGATGGFAGAAFEYDPNNLVNWNQLNFTVNLKVYLEGPFIGSTMNPTLNTVLPLNHPFHPVLPYFGNPNPVWYYNGSESVPVIPNSNIVDWILVELRDAPTVGEALPATAAGRQAAFITNTGQIVGLDGSSNLQFNYTVINNLYAVVWQRNHLGIISANPLTDIGGVLTYDFTTGSGQALGGASAQKELSPGKWGMITGDGDGNGIVQTADKTAVWNIQAGKSGYFESDYSMNKQVNNPDKNDFWKSNLGKSSILPGSFSCGGMLVDARDGQIYPSVQIGAQCWMSKNINIGSMIPSANGQSNNSIIEKYCYSNNTTYCDTYGGLYQWDEMMQYVTTPGAKGICPDGWHLPTDAEYCTLTQTIDPTVNCSETSWSGTNAGTKMKSVSGWVNGGNGTNASGFNALPAGYRTTSGNTVNETYNAHFWTSTETSFYGWIRHMAWDHSNISRYYDFKNSGFSVRCMKN